METSISHISRIVENGKTEISNISRIIENVGDFNFQYFQDRKKSGEKTRFPVFPGYEKNVKHQIHTYFQDQEKLIMNGGPYHINFRTELLKKRGPK